MEFPLFHNFKATSYAKAFILNAMISAIICALAIEFRLALEDDKTYYYVFWSNIYNEKNLNIFHKLFVTLLITFIVSILVYLIMYFLVLFGGGQLNLIYTKKASVFELLKERNLIKNGV